MSIMMENKASPNTSTMLLDLNNQYSPYDYFQMLDYLSVVNFTDFATVLLLFQCLEDALL